MTQELQDAIETAEAVADARAEQLHKESIQELLASYIGRRVDASSPVTFHDEPKNKYSIPQGTSLKKAARDIAKQAEAMETRTRTVKQINCRIEDGLVAMNNVLERVFGTVGLGVTHYSFFTGEEPPARMNVTIGMTASGRKLTKSVPCSEIEFSFLDAHIDVSSWASPEDPFLLMLIVTHVVRNQDAVDGFLQMVEDEVTQHSIYKGNILQYRADEGGGYSLDYVHRQADPTIVYTEEVQDALVLGVWGKMRNALMLEEAGELSTFKALFWGPLGTGKSEACVTSSLVARECGRTVIEYKPTGEDSIDELIRVVNIAKRYGPSVVSIEDFDRFFQGDLSPKQLSTITNLFDGSDKNNDVSFMMTTNHVENIHPAMTRAGRLTTQIEIAALDKDAVERMLKISLGDQLAADTNFDAIYEVVKDWSPAFIKSTFREARAVSIIRHSRMGLPLGTEDLISAARAKQAQAELHARMTAVDEPVVTLQDKLGELIDERLLAMRITNARTGVSTVSLNGQH